MYMRFKRALQPMQSYSLVTRVVCFDDKVMPESTSVLWERDFPILASLFFSGTRHAFSRCAFARLSD